jgi:hypothetical protein
VCDLFEARGVEFLVPMVLLEVTTAFHDRLHLDRFFV